MYGYSGPCISDEQVAEMIPQIRQEANAWIASHTDQFQALRESSGLTRGTLHISFDLPIRHKAEFADPGYFAVTNFVDHNLAPSTLSDYNCGTRTYDWSSGNHQGSDYILWPYAWQRMDEQVMEIVAGAPGVIVRKVDGYADRNCEINGSILWNAIYLLHADSSISWYLHFKSGSVTPKNLGDFVETGEYLGTAGSSGSSNIPHLHFQVFDKEDQVVDPYTGSCNLLNPDTWWNDQAAYWEPQINRISVHGALPIENCPSPEVSNEQLEFDPGDDIYLMLWAKDFLNGALIEVEIERPDGSLMNNWDFVSPWDNYSAAWVYWVQSTTTTDALGRYLFRASFNGVTYEREFYLGDAPVVSGIEAPPLLSQWQLFPNPSTDFVTLQWNNAVHGLVQVSVADAHGRLVWQQTIEDVHNGTAIPIPKFTEGVYTVQWRAGALADYRVLVVND